MRAPLIILSLGFYAAVALADGNQPVMAPPPTAPHARVSPPPPAPITAAPNLTLPQCMSNLKVAIDYANRMKAQRDSLEIQLSQILAATPPTPAPRK